MSKDPPRTLRWLSTVSGVLLVVGGIAGLVTVNPLGAVISVYNIFFGLLIVCTELKNWPIVRTFQKRVDVYFHLLSVPRGKGGFYCFIGFLAFLSSKNWDLSKICTLIVSIVGFLHLFSCKRCGAIEGDESPTAGIAPAAMEFSDSGSCFHGSDSTSTWSQMMKEVVTDNPEIMMGGARLAASAATEGLMANSGGGSGGGGSGGVGDNPYGAGTSGGDTASSPGGGTTGSGDAVDDMSR